jgi:gamma-glutamylcyclotransferase (GGCT)/AIG2-like uncharacterized protein YtfP
MGTMNVFTYGSLMFESVWSRVVRGNYASGSAVLLAHRRFAVRHQTYPAVIPKEGGVVSGVLYRSVNAEDLARLHAFEGADYRFATVQVELEVENSSAARLESAGVYLFSPVDQLEDRDWSPQWFEQTGVHEFLRTYCVDRGV